MRIVLFQLSICLAALPFVSCTFPCEVSSFTANQNPGNSVLLKWAVPDQCKDTFIITYSSKRDSTNYYLKGTLSEGSTVVNVTPCSYYEFIFEQYKKNGKKRGSHYQPKKTELGTSFAIPSVPLEPRMNFINNQSISVSWSPPKENQQCVNSYFVELFRLPDGSCRPTKHCIEENIFRKNITNTSTIITVDDLCADYRLYLRSNFGIYSSGSAKLNFSLGLNERYEAGLTNIKFSLQQKKVYLFATFKWVVPQPLPVCPPKLKIKLCSNINCKYFDESLESGVANISQLMLKTSYLVNFILISNKINQSIGELQFQTENEIPSVKNLVIEEVHSQSAQLSWTMPSGISDHCFLITSTMIKKNNDFYEYKAENISGCKSELVLKDLQPCTTYKYSIAVNYNEYSSKAVTIVLNTQEPSGTIYSVQNLRTTKVSQTTIELSWNSQFHNCYLHYEVLYTDQEKQIIRSVNATKVNIANLLPCKLYTFYIYTINKKGERKQTDFLQAKTLYQVPGKVKSLKAVVLENSVKLWWENPEKDSSCVNAYQIYLQEVFPEKTNISMLEVPGTQNITVVKNVSACTKYKFSVRSVAFDGNSSEYISTIIDTPSVVPGKVKSLKAFVIGNNVQLRWENPQKDASCVNAYLIHVQQVFPENKNISMLEVPRTQNSIDVKNLIACTKYMLSIKSVAIDGNSSEYISTIIETPSVVTHVHNGLVSNATEHSLKITWVLEESNCPINGFSSYCSGNDYSNKINPSQSKEISFRIFVHEFENLTPETTYRCFGAVHNKNAKEVWSKVVMAQTNLRNTFSNILNLRTVRCNSPGHLACLTKNQISVKTRVQRGISDTFTDFVRKIKNIFSPKETNTIVPSEPTNVTVLEVTTTSVLIAWSVPHFMPTPITGYLITKSNIMLNYFVPSSCNQSLFTNSTDAVPANVTKYLLTGFQPYTKFDINIQAIVGKVNGFSSPVISITTLPDVPDQVRHLHALIRWNQTVISWYTPCHTHGVLKYYVASMSGVRPKYPSLPQKNWTVAIKENVEEYNEVLMDLLPEYDYEINITAVVYNESKVNPKVERFQYPAGIPPEPDMTASSLIFTVLSSSQVTVAFSYNLFNDSQGEIKYYALIVAHYNFSQPPQSGWLGTNSSWPQEHTWAETKLKSGVHSYQATPLNWNPFRDTLEAQYTLGQDSCSLTDTEDFCNGPLLGNAKYSLRVRAFTASGYRDTMSVIFNTEKSVNYLYVALISLTLVVVLSVLIISFLTFTRLAREKLTKNPKRKKKIPEIKHQTGVEPLFLSAKHFLLHCNEVLEHPGNMKEEFDFLISQSLKFATPMGIALQPNNKKKNRYVNILPYDYNRVILEGHSSSDYINASYIKFLGVENNNVDFIACQAPKQDYRYDFWRMICQCNVDIIIMLCNLVEEETDKCSLYFPSLGEEVIFEDICISCEAQTKSPPYILRVLIISQNEVKRTVHHYHCTEWPDFGVPSSPEVLLRFCEEINTVTKVKRHTLAVHCSAGVGRTGTFLSLLMLLKHLKKRHKLNVFATVLWLRKQRPHMVQTQGQYVFIYKCLKFAIEEQRQKSGLRGYLRSRSEGSPHKDQITLGEKSLPTVAPSTEEQSSM